MKILLTAFTPFDGESINPALEAMKLVPDKIGNLEVLKLEVPTVFGKSANLVLETIEQEKTGFCPFYRTGRWKGGDYPGKNRH